MLDIPPRLTCHLLPSLLRTAEYHIVCLHAVSVLVLYVEILGLRVPALMCTPSWWCFWKLPMALVWH